VTCSGGNFFSSGGLDGEVVNVPSNCLVGFTGIDVSDTEDYYIYQVWPKCGDDAFNGQFRLRGGAFDDGTTARGMYDCPPGMHMIGITGLSDSDDNRLYAVSFVCSERPIAPPSTVVNVLGPFGGRQGDEFFFACPDEEHILNISGRQHSEIVDSVSVTCSGGSSFTTGGSGGAMVNLPSCPVDLPGAYVAADGDGVYQLKPLCTGLDSAIYRKELPRPVKVACPQGMTLKGISGRSGEYLFSIKLVYSSQPIVSPISTLSEAVLGPFGGDGTEFKFICHGDYSILHFGGRLGDRIYRVMIICSDGTFFSAGEYTSRISVCT